MGPPATEIDYRELARHVAAFLDPEALWEAADIAAYSKYSVRHVQEVLRKKEGFPKPFSIDGGHPRWRRQDVVDFLTGNENGPRKAGRPRRRS